MRFLAFADIHIGQNVYGTIDNTTGLHTQAKDLLQCTDQLVQYAIINDIKHIILAGDVFESRNPSSMDRKIFNMILKKFIEHKLNLYVISGNHDDLMTHTTALNNLEMPENIHIYEKASAININNISIVFVPHVSKRWITRKFDSFVTDSKLHKDYINICVCHELLGGSYLNGKVLKNSYDIKCLKDYDLVIAGDVHHHQQLKNIYYTGVLNHLSFNDIDTFPGFLDIDINCNTKSISINHIPTQCRKFYQLSGNTKELLNYISKIHLKENDVLKVNLLDTKENINSFSTFLQDLKNKCICSIKILSIKSERKKTSTKFVDGNIPKYIEYCNSNNINKNIINLGKKILEDLS